MRKTLDLAYINWKYCEGYTDQEIANSQANLKTAEANYQKANQAYQDLKNSQGIEALDLNIALAALENAQQQLKKSQLNLQNATLLAPIDGTITAINGSVGDKVDTSTFISIADLKHPEIQVNIDETDLKDFQIGCPAQVTFDTIPGRVFHGLVSEITPSLVTTRNVDSLQGKIIFEDAVMNNQQTLPLGINASAEITCHQTQNVLLAPINALHEPAGLPAFVYVLNASGQPEKRIITVGFKTTAFAEITSGLKEGEQLVTNNSKLP
jgi:HlyD family secretion protein